MALTITYGVSSVQTVSNSGTSAAIQVTQTGNTSASTSVGGAVNVDNTLNTGAGLVVYSDQASPSGRLIVARANNATFSQTAMFAQTAGTGHAFHADNTATNNATGSAINATSTNTGNSCMFVSGVETGRGTIKVTHTGTGSDANASGLSIDCAGSGTAAKGIFLDATGGGTTGDLVDLRNNGNQLFKFQSVSLTRPVLVLGNGGPIITFHTATPEGAITAPVGSICFNTGGGASTTLYVKTSGTGNTGWTAK
jgi:hypothetical protein